MNLSSAHASPGDLLAEAERAVKAVVGAGFDVVCGPDEAVEFARAAERIGRLASAAAVAAASALERSRAFVEYRVRDTAAVLTTMCRVERAEAVRRVAVADIVGDRATLTGDVLPPVLPALRDAIVAGEVSGRSAQRVASTFTKIDAVLTESSRDALTAVLVGAARVEDDAFVRAIAKRVLIDANPDGTEPSAAMLRLRQGITFGVEQGGLVPFSGAMTSLQCETVLTTIGVFTNPRLQQPDDGGTGRSADGTDSGRGADRTGSGHGAGGTSDADSRRGPDASGERATAGPRFVELDPNDGGASIRVPVSDRTRAQLLLDGLVASCELAARTGKLPRNGGVKPTVIVTLSLDDLQSRGGVAEATFAGSIPAASIRQVACDANIMPVVLNTAGAPVDIGRSKRLFDGDLRTALITRDGGCAFPNCDLPAPWTDGHHIQHWADGGETSLDNGVLLCRAHHTLIHCTEWRITMIDHIPFFVPPWQVDAHQVPRRNLLRYRPPVSQRAKAVARG